MREVDRWLQDFLGIYRLSRLTCYSRMRIRRIATPR